MNEENTKSFQDSLYFALKLFNDQKWYEAHDAFEDIWNTVDGDQRQVIQGILQVSVSQFHLSKGNLNVNSNNNFIYICSCYWLYSLWKTFN